jgi:hypothetical protein
VRAVPDGCGMNGTDIDVDLARLMGEIHRYLAAVDEFRSAGCVPKWRREIRRDRASTQEGSS